MITRNLKEREENYGAARRALEWEKGGAASLHQREALKLGPDEIPEGAANSSIHHFDRRQEV